MTTQNKIQSMCGWRSPKEIKEKKISTRLTLKVLSMIHSFKVSYKYNVILFPISNRLLCFCSLYSCPQVVLGKTFTAELSVLTKLFGTRTSVKIVD